MTIIENLPPKLRETGLFCCWKLEERDGKSTKMPYNSRTGSKASSSNPATFAPLNVAQAVAHQYDGLGVGVFDNLAAVDIDHCRNPETRELTPTASDIVNIMQSYTEISPSGTGIRILFNAAGFQYDKARYYIKNSKIGLEVYVAGATNRFVTVTGNTLTPGMDLEERGEQLAAVLEKYMVRPTQEPPAPSVATNKAVLLDDDTLLSMARRGRNGAAFARLWTGDISEYPSQSEADLSLCNSLAWWTNKDPAQMDRLFRRSGLMREKWDRAQSGSTYGAITIQNAIRSCRGGYSRTSAQQDFDGLFASVRPTDFTDAGNSGVFVRMYRDELIYTDSLGWLHWNGQMWERSDHCALAMALRLSDQMLEEAQTGYRTALHAQAEAQAKYAASGDEADGRAVEDADIAAKAAKAYLTWAGKSRDATKLRHMTDLAKPALVVKADQLDSNPFDLNTPGGIADLRTGVIRPHEREAYCSRITGATPGEEGAEMWAAFLDTITGGDKETQQFLQEVAGMAAIGAVFQEGIIIAYGGGRNGKSTFFNALDGALGDYSGGIAVETITTDRTNKGAALATLRGKRLVVTGELEEHQRLSAATLKRLASTDRLTIEEKFKAPETVRQTHTLTMFTNHLPRVGSTDAGTWRRLIVVPFNTTIPEGSGIQNYADVLVEKAGGAILSWVIRGAVKFVLMGFKLRIPAAVAVTTDEYRQREDWLNSFISERCIRDPGARIGAAELYQAYREWATMCNEYVRRQSEFAAAMEMAGFQKITPKNKKTWMGLRINLAEIFANPYAATV